MSGIEPKLLFVTGADEFDQRTRRRFGNDVIAAGQNMQKRRRDIGQADAVTTDNQPVCHQRILTRHLDDLPGHPTRQGNLSAGPSGHGLIGRDVLIAPQPFPQVDVLGDFGGRPQRAEIPAG